MDVDLLHASNVLLVIEYKYNINLIIINIKKIYVITRPSNGYKI